MNNKLKTDICFKIIKAIKLVLQEGYCSTQLIKEKLEVGDNMAGRIIDWLEENEIVAPFSGSKKRNVLYKRDEK